MANLEMMMRLLSDGFADCLQLRFQKQQGNPITIKLLFQFMVVHVKRNSWIVYVDTSLVRV
jgi:hypothetical protein